MMEIGYKKGPALMVINLLVELEILRFDKIEAQNNLGYSKIKLGA
ncbi:2108_t:CDS:2 [Funneliformis geosporum]|nr:2108_t:CDS:2 [Funneliformis geosporum]